MNRGTPTSSGGGKARTAVPGGVGGQPEQEAVMTTDTKRNAITRRPITADELPPEIKGRVKGLIYDLSNDDLPMALLDLAHLYRALRRQGPGEIEDDEPIELT